MKIYTGTAGGCKEKIENVKRLDLGFCVSADPDKAYKNISCFVDNGAFEAWRRGLPWSENRFMALLDKFYTCGLSADFVVCPDIVMGGMDSFDFSMSWAPRLRPARLALAVQDGMDFNIIDCRVKKLFTHIFVGGSVSWKWQTAKEWGSVAHKNSMKLHIGRCGTLARLRQAVDCGADSVDSTSWIRNESWHILEEFLKPQQERLEI